MIAAAAVSASDRLLEQAARSRPGIGLHAPVLAVLAQDPQGRTIRWIADALRISHSRAVRVADALEADGLARRTASSGDRREVRLRLTQAGSAAARELHQARTTVMTELLSELTAEEVTQFAELSAKILHAAATGRVRARSICRLCDADVCGHHEGRCPATAGADAHEAAQQ